MKVHLCIYEKKKYPPPPPPPVKVRPGVKKSGVGTGGGVPWTLTCLGEGEGGTM